MHNIRNFYKSGLAATCIKFIYIMNGIVEMQLTTFFATINLLVNSYSLNAEFTVLT
jgi:hypothetical protein